MTPITHDDKASLWAWQWERLRNGVPKPPPGGWDLPAVKTSADSFEKETAAFAADRSEGIQDKLRSLTNDQVLGANQRIQLRASKLSDEQRAEQMPGIVAEEYGKATTALNAFKADIQNRAVAFDVELASANSLSTVSCSSPDRRPSLAISIETASTCLGLSMPISLAASSCGRLMSIIAALRRLAETDTPCLPPCFQAC